MKTFIAGGGFGDCILILNKFRQLAGPEDRMVYYLAEKQSNSRGIIEEFWETQKVRYEIRMVPEISTPLSRYDRRDCRKLNPLVYGMGAIMVERWKFVFYPFDTFATPRMEFEMNPSPYTERYFVVQSDAGTMKYRGHKNWLNTGWIEDFIAGARATGLKCVLLGSKDVWIKGADDRRCNRPLKDVFGILSRAEFVLGLQGFITIAALCMIRRVL